MAQAATRRVGRRAWMVAAAAAPWLAGPVRGADTPPGRYAVLSLVGDRIHLVRRRQEVGSNLIDPHDRGHAPVDTSDAGRRRCPRAKRRRRCRCGRRCRRG